MTSRLATDRAGSRSLALVIDDAPETLGMISAALEESGMTVLVARSGEEGIRLSQRVNPDVILLDAMMPGLDGFETCRRLKSAPLSETAPVIFMTGMSEPENILCGLQAGGVDYITKPVIVEELIARITTHVINARAVLSARSALDYTGQSVLAFTNDGLLLWSTQAARQLLLPPEGAILCQGDRAQDELRVWLLESDRQPLSVIHPLTLGRFTLTIIGNASGEMVVRIRDALAQSDESRLLKVFGLTAREAEVLLWLSHGKTNRDIADILGLSARTINKHLEQIFHKMGVDNRTSAAVMADRVLQTTD